MKHRKPDRRGVLVVMPLVLMGLIAAFSALILQQTFRERVYFERNRTKIQKSLLQDGVNGESFRRRFADDSSNATASWFDDYGFESKEYIITVDPSSEPFAAFVEVK